MNGKDHSLERKLTHDGIVHHPLGGGSYVFKKDYVDYLLNQLTKEKIRISVGAQPNSSPHFGTLVVFNLAYALAQKMSINSRHIYPEVFFEVIDTAPAETRTIGGIEYQISLRDNNIADTHIEEYLELLGSLKNMTGINYTLRKQQSFNSQTNIPHILKKVIQHRTTLASLLDPQRQQLRIRVACPICGLTDKNGAKNKYHEGSMESFCPAHGSFETSFDSESSKFEYNTPLRNLIRGLSYSLDNIDKNIPFEWLRVTGGDYAGYYQEQLLYKTASLLGTEAHKLPTIIYAPLVTDWSGAKLSKSLYVKQNAYKDLPQYLVNYKQFREHLGNEGAKKMFAEVSSWVDDSFKLFRSYSVYYFMELFGNE